MRIDEIENKEDILKYMNSNIEYGWIDKYGEKHIKTMKEFRRIYLTLSIEDTIKIGIGTCIEQVRLMKYLCDKIGLKSKMYCTRIYEDNNFNDLDAEEHMHWFLLVFENDKVYHKENPNFERIGIYTYENENQAINTINEYYINLSGGIARPVTEFFEVEPGLTFKEFNNYINNNKL